MNNTIKINLVILINILIVFTTIAPGCSKEFGEEYIAPALTHQLIKVGEYEIPVDSVTSTRISHYQYFTHDTVEYFSMLNTIKQEINAYNLNTKTLSFKIPLHLEGPNGIGNLIGFNSGYYIHNLDSIFVLNRDHQRLYLLNSRSELINQFDLFQDKGQASGVLPPFAPMFVNNGKGIILNIQGAMSYNTPNKNYDERYATIIDLSKKSPHEYFLGYPEKFTKGAWGIDLHRISWTVNDLSNSLIVSYAIEDDLFEYSKDGKFLRRIEQKTNFINELRSITESESNFEARQKYVLAQSKYGPIYFDNIRKVYIRDFYGPMSDTDIQNGTYGSFRQSLIILDEQLEVIAIMKDKDFNAPIIFTNKEGIHRYKAQENENILKFEVFDLVKNQ
ncbi:DUF4221 family protein [Roseivirga pacifica]|uniref:DUF4221 family protein n=1 Tax=Roseivirga pacifica TaxID=1267423 RepID=UPI003BAF842E